VRSGGTAPDSSSLAAVDLGSNSFHLIVAREESGAVRMLDRLRDRVALAEGLTQEGRLTAPVEERALACLRRFRERLIDVPTDRVRAVGTATFRKLERGCDFLAGGAEALGHEIEILPGREEARLVYLGVAQTLGDDAGRRLVVDIGGGSTECVLGERFESEYERTLSMGCVRWSLEHFRGGKISRSRMERAELAGRLQLEPIETAFRRRGWQSCVGSSGTIRAVAEILRANGWGDGTITPRGLTRITRALIDAGHADRLDLAGLEEDRRGVIAGGVAVLRAVFAGLGVERMEPCKGALREGLLYDLLGRIHHEDVRESSVTAFAERFGVDAAQAERVRETVLEFFEQVRAPWKLGETERRMLTWAASLHEVGLTVAWPGFHKHGAYMVEHADLRGFSRQGRERLALLVRAHRRRVPVELIEDLPRKLRKKTRRMVLLMRLAVRLHRGRGALDLPPLGLEVDGSQLRLVAPADWLLAHPLVRADVEDEALVLAPLGFELELG